jgi:hypothetical protein
MTLSVADLHPALHDLFSDTADAMARELDFCRRARKITGAVFAQTLVFSLWENPAATLDDFTDTAFDVLGVDVTPQAFDKRFNPPAAALMRDLFVEAFNRSFDSVRPAVLPLLHRFNGVFLRDATLVSLPPALADFFPGRGGRHSPHGKAAALKVVLEAEVSTGALTEVSLVAGLDNDRTAEVAGKPLPAGALLLEDMGFLSGDRLAAYIEQGVYVVTRIPAWTAVFDETGRRIDLVKELRRAKGWKYERSVRIMNEHKVKVRLLAVRLPQEEADKRRQRVIKEAKQRGRPLSHKKLDLCAWNIVVTNAPPGLLGAEEANVLRRVRWQIELVFKVFKSQGKIDQTRSKCRYRVLCEVYAKLLAMVIQQWVVLAAGYVMLRHSVLRAARRVRQRALQLLGALAQMERLGREVARLAKILHRRCRIVHRHASPSTFDRLCALDPRFDQDHEAA